MKYILILCAALILGGCTQGQVERAEKAAADAKVWLARVEHAEAQAASAVESTRAMAVQLGSQQALAIVEKAEATLALVTATRETAQAAAVATEHSAASAKAAHAAGGSTIDVLLAILATAVPAVGAFIPLIRKLAATGKALSQTVKGVQSARDNLGETAWKEKVKPALDAAQDEAVRTEVARVLAAKG